MCKMHINAVLVAVLACLAMQSYLGSFFTSLYFALHQNLALVHSPQATLAQGRGRLPVFAKTHPAKPHVVSLRRPTLRYHKI